MFSTTKTQLETEYYSVALIGSSGGGTASLGHLDPVKFLSTIHHELLRVRDDASVVANSDQPTRQRRVCLGLSRAIFVSLCDGGGFDSIGDHIWAPHEDESRGPCAALFTVGLQTSLDSENDFICDGSPRKFQVTQIAKGPLSKINAEVERLERTLAMYFKLENSHTRAIISVSSEPSLFHSTLTNASKKFLPVTGSGGTSLGILASKYDLRIIGNSGGSVASTTLTKARGWAKGLAVEWNMRYNTDYTSVTETSINSDTSTAGASMNIMPSLKSILEAALPSFLFVCMSIRFISVWLTENEVDEHAWSNTPIQQEQPIKVLEFALRHIVTGTACCVLSATSRSTETTGTLIAATLTGIITTSSASLASNTTSCGGGGALAGLVAGALLPPAISAVSIVCTKYNVTATMTNILLAGGVGTSVGLFMHISGLAYLLGVLTGLIRCLLQLRKLAPITEDFASWPLLKCLTTVELIQQYWINLSASPQLSKMVYHFSDERSMQYLPVPIGLGFVCGCIFVFGSKNGWYHSIFLPLILIEMDGSTFPSLLGAMDECTLVMVCAGICAGNLILTPPSKGNGGGAGHNSLSLQALKTNILCGDFIEAAYPYMDTSKLVNGSAYIAAGLSCEVLLQRRVYGSAYLPLPLVIWMSSDILAMGLSCVIAFNVCFVGTLFSNLFSFEWL